MHDVFFLGIGNKTSVRYGTKLGKETPALMRYYTKKGDKGTTQAREGVELPKNHPLIALAGALDEAEARTGFAASYAKGLKEECAHTDTLYDALLDIQREIFYCGSVALAYQKSDEKELARHRERIEVACDHFSPEGQQTKFYLPGGCELAARIELARTGVRMAERELCTAIEQGARREALPLLNRLSDELYALARYANQQAGVSETPTSF